MSHTVEIKCEMKNVASIKKACDVLKWPCVENSSSCLYDGKTIMGTVVSIPKWRYPAIIQESGAIAVDTYGSAWGDEKDLDKLKQRYSLEEAKSSLSTAGLYGYETLNEVDGSITLEVQTY